jgi:hypothetical protein
VVKFLRLGCGGPFVVRSVLNQAGGGHPVDVTDRRALLVEGLVLRELSEIIG